MCILGTLLTFNEFQISFKRRTNLDTIMRGNAKGVIKIIIVVFKSCLRTLSPV